MPGTIRIVKGTANPGFADAVCEALTSASTNYEVIPSDIGNFPDGETRIKIEKTVRGHDVYLIQATCPPVNDNLAQLCLTIDALKRASARSVTAIISYFGYARQERKPAGRVPISARWTANAIEAAEADRVVAIDLHAGAIQGFFTIPLDDLKAKPVFVQYIKEHFPDLSKVGIASPDKGGIFRARSLAKALKVHWTMVDKDRDPETNETESLYVVGNVEGLEVIEVDDILSTGTTLADGAVTLIEAKAASVIAVVTHGIFAGNAKDIIESSPLKKVIVSDTVPLPESVRSSKKVEVVSLAPMVAEAIRRIHCGESVSAMLS